MSNRIYRFFFGLILLIALYVETDYLIYTLIVIGLIEAITNLRIPILVCSGMSSFYYLKKLPVDYLKIGEAVHG